MCVLMEFLLVLESFWVIRESFFAFMGVILGTLSYTFTNLQATVREIKKIMENSIIGRGEGVSDVKFHNSKKYSLFQ